MIYLLYLVFFVLISCSCMDQAGAYALSGALTPEEAGQFLLWTAASDEQATNRMMNVGMSFLDWLAVGGVISTVAAGGAVGVVRKIRGSPLKSGSGKSSS